MKKKMMIILATGLCLASQAVSVYGADYEYDDLGRVTKVVYEDGSSVTYTYDANGNIVEVLTGMEWEDEEGNEENEAGSSGSGMTSGGEKEGNKAPGDMNQSGEAGEDGNRSDGQGGSSKEDEKDEENHQADNEENIEGQEGNEAKEKESGRIENMIAGILAVLGIAALFLIRRLRNGNWNAAGAGRENQDGEKNQGGEKDNDGRDTKENRGDGEVK